jgi:hypothetical protein
MAGAMQQLLDPRDELPHGAGIGVTILAHLTRRFARSQDLSRQRGGDLVLMHHRPLAPVAGLRRDRVRRL